MQTCRTSATPMNRNQQHLPATAQIVHQARCCRGWYRKDMRAWAYAHRQKITTWSYFCAESQSAMQAGGRARRSHTYVSPRNELHFSALRAFMKTLRLLLRSRGTVPAVGRVSRSRCLAVAEDQMTRCLRRPSSHDLRSACFLLLLTHKELTYLQWLILSRPPALP